MRRLILVVSGIIIIGISYLYISNLLQESTEVFFNGREIDLDHPAIVEDDTLLIPAIPVLETLGFEAVKDAHNRITATKGNYKTGFTPYGSTSTIHNNTTSFNVALENNDDKILYLPALKAVEALGLLNSWDRDSGAYHIDIPQAFDPELPEGQEEPLLYLAYPPRNGFNYYSNDLFVFGTTQSYSAVWVTVNGKPVDIIDHRTGNFLTMIEIPRGEEYLLTVEATSAKNTTRVERTVLYPDWWQAMSEETLAIHENHRLPGANQVLQAGDTLQIAVQGSPGADATYQLGNNNTVYHMMERAHPGGPAGRGGIYTATYSVSENDLPESGETTLLPITVALQKGSAVVSQELPGKIAFTAEQPYRYIEVRPEHELKNNGWLYHLRDNELNLLSSTFGGSGHPTTVINYLREGTRYRAIGRAGSYYRVTIPGSRSIYLIHQNMVKELTDTQLSEPVLNDIEFKENSQKVSVLLKTTERFPYFTDDSAQGLKIELRGVITKDNFSVSTMPEGISEFKVDPLIPGDSNNQLVTIELDWSMKGFKPYWEGNNLVIDFYKPSEINLENPLKGKKIIIDPGHGGRDTGATGPGHLDEKDVNLNMSLSLKNMLEEAGAEVIMTRTEDVYVNLYDRPERIDAYNPDLLISVHANAHRHGAQAVETHGLMTLYNYEHNKILAEIMLDKLAERTGLPAMMTWRRNIAVVRHSHVPTVLVEAGYMMHPVDNWYILHPRGQEEFALAMMEGIEAYFLEFAEYKKGGGKGIKVKAFFNQYGQTIN